jgi:uncharacterized protein (DUF2147 family)
MRHHPREDDMTKLTPIRAFTAIGLTILALPALATAAAADPSGTYLRDTGASRVRIAKCGPAFCGNIVWLKDASGPAKVGQRIFYDMKPNGENAWTGKAFNPEDGKTYSGKMSLSGSKLTTAGCALGGLICRSVVWSKVD